jgi:GNAT superfamily N-acetyltransferase
MHRLIPDAYTRSLPLFADMDNHLPVVAALEGSIPAEVYADDLVQPRVALISVRHRRLYLAGQPSEQATQEMARLFRNTLYPAMAAEQTPVFSLCCTLPTWEAHIDALLAGKKAVRTEREYYEFARGQALAPVALPPGYELRAVDAAWLADDHLANMDALREEMMSEHASVEDFLAHSFGVCPIKDDALAGWCLSEYNTENRCEVGIATLPPHQGQGLATAAGAAFVEDAGARGVVRIGWHCYKENRASGATARRIGFRKVEDYPAYVVWCSKHITQ